MADSDHSIHVEPRFPTHLWQWLSDFSLRTKFMLAFLLVTALSTSSVAFLSASAARAQLTTDVGASLKNQALAQSLVVGNTLAQQLQILQAFALSKIVQDAIVAQNSTYQGDRAAIDTQITAVEQRWAQAADGDPLIQRYIGSDIASELREFHDTFPDHADVLVTDRYGALLAASSRTEQYAYADQAWWQSAWNNGSGAIFIGQPTFDQRSQSFVLMIAIPMVAHDTVLAVGVLQTTYHLTPLITAIDAVRVGSSGRAQVALPDGQIIGRTGGDETIPPAQWSHLQGTSADYAEFDYQGDPSLVSLAPVRANAGYAAIDQLGWSAIIYEPRAESLAPVSAAAWTTLITTLIALLIVGLVGFGFAQLLSTPIGRLTQAVQQLAIGNTRVTLPVTSRDEFGTLARSFNHMTAELATAREQLEHMNQGLEDTVAKRTAALGQTLAELQESMHERDQLSETIRAVSNPVIPVLHGVVVVPLIGEITYERADHLTQSVLQATEQHHANIVIIDVTGVPIIDTQVAQVLVNTGSAVALLGGRTILVGIRPEVAQTIIGLGADLSSLTTRATLQSAIESTIIQMGGNHRQ